VSIIFTKTLDNGNLTIIISPISFVSQPGIHRKGAMESRKYAETALTAPAVVGGSRRHVRTPPPLARLIKFI